MALNFESMNNLSDLSLFIKAINSANDGITITNMTAPDQPLIFVNEAFERMTGYSKSEIIGQNCRFLQRNVRDQPGIQIVREAIINHKNCRVVLKNFKKDGTLFWNELSLAPILDSDGKLCYYVGIQKDVSYEKALEEIKNEFISIVTHELRTPITSIHGALNIALSHSVPLEEIDEVLQIAQRNCERLLRLVNDLLDIKKIEAGQIEYHFERIKMDKIINEAVLVNTSFADKFNVKLEYVKSQQDFIVNVDHDRMMQVLTNLISNAVKYSPPGQTVSITIEQIDSNHIRVNVTDRGPGIPKQFHDKVFEKFSQFDSLPKKLAGTGLGLNITKLIVEGHGGTIGFETAENKGTTFYFDLLIANANSG